MIGVVDIRVLGKCGIIRFGVVVVFNDTGVVHGNVNAEEMEESGKK